MPFVARHSYAAKRTPGMLCAAALAAASAALAPGCGGKAIPEGQVAARGRIHLADGTPLSGVLGQICFCPVDPKRPNDREPYKRGELPGARCVGPIQEDGSFELWTKTPGDGAVPAIYKVFFLSAENERPGPPIVPKKYTEYKFSPWIVEVKAGEENVFDLKLEAK